jgi:hypothetical protein
MSNDICNNDICNSDIYSRLVSVRATTCMGGLTQSPGKQQPELALEAARGETDEKGEDEASGKQGSVTGMAQAEDQTTVEEQTIGSSHGQSGQAKRHCPSTRGRGGFAYWKAAGGL